MDVCIDTKNNEHSAFNGELIKATFLYAIPVADLVCDLVSDL